MGNRYWITGVQLGMIRALAGSNPVQEILLEIEEKQFIGNRQDLERMKKSPKGGD